MIRRLPLAPIQLAYLILLTYFACYRPSWLVLGLLLASVLRLLGHGRAVMTRTVLVLLAFAGLFTYRVYRAEQLDQTAPSHLTSLVLIPDSVSINGDSLSFRGRSAGRTYQTFYQLTSEKEQTFFKTLTQPISISGEFDLSEAEQERNFKGFDYRAYLKTQGIYQTAKLTKISQLNPTRLTNPFDYLSLLRRQAIVHIQTRFPAPMRHYMTGLLFGYLDKEFEQMSDIYSSLGIIHLFALSGMQVGFFLGWFRKILLRLGLTLEQVDALQVPFSVVYAGLTGLQVSVVRSLIQSLLSRQGFKGLDNLALTLITCLLLLPNSLLTTGGVLSFTYAFVLALMKLDEFDGWRRTLVESLALSLAVLPVLIWYFGTFQPISLVLTAAFSLIFDSLMLPALTMIFALSPLLAVTVLNPLFEGLEAVIGLLGQWLSRPLVFGSPSLLVLLALIVSLGLLYDYRRHRRAVMGLSLVIALLFFITKNPLQNEVTVLDIGQGDSIFLRDMWGKTLLIDTGGKVDFAGKEAWQTRQTDSNAQRTNIPYLKSRGVGKIDQLVLTHTDTDHMGDMEDIAKNFAIGEVLVSQGSLTKESFVRRLKAMRVKVRVVTAGDSLPIMGSHLQVLYPWETGDGGNNDSIILYGRLLNKNFLFTGDLEEGELELIKRYPSLPVDVLKAGHHGSKGSSYPEFLAHIGADTALISAGKNNRYHHPNPETLERFAKEQMTVYRTDQQGAIRYKGWRTWTVETVR